MKSKIHLPFFLFFLYWIQLSGQDTLKVEYFDKDWNPVELDGAFLIRTTYRINKPYASYAISVKRHDGVPFFDGEYSSLNPKIEEGSFKFFHSVKGYWVVSKGFYAKGELQGKWTSDASDYHDMVDYNFEITRCTDTINLFTLNDYKQWPEFDGKVSVNSFYEYVDKEGYYPPLMQKEKQHGTVHLSFIVDRDGNIYNAKVEKGLGNDLDKEALRLVVNSSGRWSAKIIDGEEVNSRLNLKIPF